MASASMGELRQALKACLEERGVLSEVRATVRSNIFKCLDESGHSKPPPSERTSLMNQLIAEYLSFNGYRYSSPPRPNIAPAHHVCGYDVCAHHLRALQANPRCTAS